MEVINFQRNFWVNLIITLLFLGALAAQVTLGGGFGFIGAGKRTNLIMIHEAVNS